MSSKFSPILIVAIVVQAVSGAAVLQQDGQVGYNQQQQQQQRVPILYEAYYPEPRDLSAPSRLREIEQLRELASELLGQERRLKQLAAEIAPAEDVLAPRSQLLEYAFSRPVVPLSERVRPAGVEDVGVASLTVSDERRPERKIRHHHGEWLLRRLAADEQDR